MNIGFDFSDLVPFEREHERVKAERDALLEACRRMLDAFGGEQVDSTDLIDEDLAKFDAVLHAHHAIGLAVRREGGAR